MFFLLVRERTGATWYTVTRTRVLNHAQRSNRARNFHETRVRGYMIHPAASLDRGLEQPGALDVRPAMARTVEFSLFLLSTWSPRGIFHVFLFPLSLLCTTKKRGELDHPRISAWPLPLRPRTSVSPISLLLFSLYLSSKRAPTYGWS